jgi:hypothetical protein
LGRAKSKREKDLRRRVFWLMRRMERRRMLDEGFWDREKAELVALGIFPFHNVGRGEVLFDQRIRSFENKNERYPTENREFGTLY